MARSNKKNHGGVQVDHTPQLPRLRRIEGQVRGLQQMVTDERNCIDIANQISAVIAALRRVQGDMLRDHLTAIAAAVAQGDMSETERRRLADEVGKVTTRLG